jgi:hypothetical protein
MVSLAQIKVGMAPTMENIGVVSGRRSLSTIRESCSCADVLIVDDNTFNIYTLKLMIQMKNPALVCD